MSASQIVPPGGRWSRRLETGERVVHVMLTRDMALAARPIADIAHRRALDYFTAMSSDDPWSFYRVGVTAETVWIAPAPHKGKQNHPTFGWHTVVNVLEPSMEEGMPEFDAALRAMTADAFRL